MVRDDGARRPARPALFQTVRQSLSHTWLRARSRDELSRRPRDQEREAIAMLIFDQLNKADRHLRVLSWVMAAGLVMLLGGLWWVQVVRSRHFVEAQGIQSYRTVRIPAPRGKIFDRNGATLAENRPTYNVSLFLEDPRWREA